MARVSSNLITGRAVANALRRSWRDSNQALSLSADDFEVVMPLLYDSGGAGLGWWQIRDTPLALTPSGELLHQAFRLLTLEAAIHQTKIQRVFSALRRADIDPILIKGWAMARLYPQPGLRPYGDIDLIVHPHKLSAATAIGESEELRDCRIDWHAPAFELADRSIDDLYSRSQLAQCGEEAVRILSHEDHLALVSIHLLRHAAWRPLWLCDVALLLETIESGFDWSVCLGADRRRRNWILSAISLACELLHATPPTDPVVSARAPQWLIEGVLQNWAEPFVGKHAPHKHRTHMKSYLSDPRGLLTGLKARWPDPILATITVNGTFGERPRLSYQIRNWVQRAGQLVKAITQAT